MGFIEQLNRVGEIKVAARNKAWQVVNRVYDALIGPGDFVTSPDPDLSRTAYTFLVQASRQYPSSVSAQAACIALECREARKKPGDLMGALLKDPNKILALAETANRIHNSQTQRRVGVVDAFQVREVIIADFTVAGYMMRLPKSRIALIGDLYRQYHDNPPNVREGILQRTIEGWVGREIPIPDDY